MTQFKRGLVGLGAVALVAASFVGPVSAQSPAADDQLIVGVSWNNFNEPRWAAFDEPAIKAALEAAGAQYISTDAASSAEQQLADVETLITQGADALIILAQDGTAILPAVQSAVDAGIPVVAYDRLIRNDGTLYLSFDNKGVGRIMAETIFPLVPKGNYAIIKGNQADANADFLRAGMEEVIGAAVAAGDIVIPEGCETVHRQLGCGQRADQHGELPRRGRQRHPGRARGERRHGRWRHRGADGPGPRRSRSRARTATRARSTASRWAPRPSRSGRTPASLARLPVRLPWRSRAAPPSRSSRTPLPSSTAT